MMCMYICIRAYTHTWIWIYKLTCINENIHTCVIVNLYIYSQGPGKIASNNWASRFIRLCVCRFMHMNEYAYIHIVYIHIHIYI